MNHGLADNERNVLAYQEFNPNVASAFRSFPVLQKPLQIGMEGNTIYFIFTGG